MIGDEDRTVAKCDAIHAIERDVVTGRPGLQEQPVIEAVDPYRRDVRPQEHDLLPLELAVEPLGHVDEMREVHEDRLHRRHERFARERSPSGQAHEHPIQLVDVPPEVPVQAGERVQLAQRDRDL